MNDAATPSLCASYYPATSRAITEMIRVILPSGQDTCALQAALWNGELGRTAWSAWRQQLGDEQDLARIKRLLPLLAIAQRRYQEPLEPRLATHLRTAYTRESFRSQTLREVCGRAFASLGESEVPFIALKGVALAERVYPEPALRHCHDCDLLVPPGSHGQAVQALSRSGFHQIEDRRPKSGGTQLVHEHGLPLHLHVVLFEIPTYRACLDDLWSRAGSAALGDAEMGVLGAEDAFIHVCGHASYSPSRQHLSWVCDSWMILQSQPNLDWDAVCKRAGASQLSLPLSIVLTYLARTLRAPIPEQVLSHLAGARTTAVTREAALFGAAAGPPGTVAKMCRRAKGIRAWATLIKWMFLPAPSHLRWRFHIQRPFLIPLYYAYRPFFALLRRLRQCFG